MIYASKNRYNLPAGGTNQTKELLANIQIFSPHQNMPVFQVDLPLEYLGGQTLSDSSQMSDKYWLGFCLRGGQGINKNGVSVSDPTALSNDKPLVYRDCVADPSKATTLGISQPQNLQANVISKDTVEFSWEQP